MADLRSDALKEVFDRQRSMQVMLGADPEELEGEARIDYIRTMVLALEDELHEALAETGWKPWATSRHINTEAFGGELVDAFHFLINLFLVIGWDESDVINGYFLKSRRNEDRQRQGYDGVSGKCQVCKRALDDDATQCAAGECAR